MSFATAFQECPLNTEGFSITDTENQTRNGFLKSARRGKNSMWHGRGKANGRFWGTEGKVGVGFLLFISFVVHEIGNFKNPSLEKA